MKLNIKALELIKKGLSVKTVEKLTEGQISVLHSKLVSEQITEIPSKKTYKIGPKGGSLPANPKGYSVRQDPNTKEVLATAAEEEMKEDDNVDMEKDPFELQSTQDKRETGPSDYGNNPKVDKEMDADDADGMGMMEGRKRKKSNQKTNPWAICTAQLGKEFKTTERHLWNTKQKNKYERCVKDVKKSLKEGKNPVSLFIESEIMKIVERNLPPRITKGDLVKYLSEQGPATAPTKPTTKPTTKPGKPDTRPRPKHPGKNPNPGENPAPKARKIEPKIAKDEVIDLILNLLDK